MKILFLSYTYWPPHFGGELLIAIERLQEMSARGHTVVALTSGTRGKNRNQIENGIIMKGSLYLGTGKLLKLFGMWLYVLWAILFLVFTSNTDILHINSLPGLFRVTKFFNGFIFSKIAYLKRIKVVFVHALADEPNCYFKANYLERFFFGNVDVIVCVSDGLYKAVTRYFPNKTKKIYCGVRTDIFHPLNEDERYQSRNLYGIQNDDIVFTFLGSVNKRKGFDLISILFSKLLYTYPNWHLWVIGPRTSKESQNINNLEVAEIVRPLEEYSERVCYWGRINDRSKIAQLLGVSDIFLFPSRREGFGIAPLEAMSVGIPPIISRITGVTDLACVDGESGYYFSPENIDEMHEKILRLAENRELRKELGENARNRIEKGYSWEKHVNDWETLYQKLSNNKML